MEKKPISVQLYSLREECKDDFVGVLEKLAAIGYAGVEPAGFHNLTPAEFKKVVDDLGLKVSSSHSPWCSPDNIAEVIDIAGVIGVDHVTCGYGPNEFATLDAIKATADGVNTMIDGLRGSGLTLMQHNHAWEFETLDGRLKYDIYAELCPEVQFELDVYWVSNFGAVNAPEQIRNFAPRTPFLHIKDGPLERDIPMVAVGQGKMDIPACIDAADPSVLKWLVVELDACATDMMTAVEESYKYLVDNGLGEGNR